MTILDEPPGDLLTGVDVPQFASWTRRVVAALLDSAILTGTAFVVEGYLHGIAWWGSSGAAGATPPGREVLVAGAVLLALQAFTGATPGKRVAGIRVVHEVTGRPIGVLRTLGREVAHIVDAICWIGYLRPLWHERRRTIADSAAGTDVVLGRPGPRVGGVDAWTAAAAALCTIAVGLSTGGSTSYSGGSTFPCTASDGSRVDLRVPSTSSTTRLGVTRAGSPTDDLTATWTYPPGTVPPDGTELASRITADDGSETNHTTTVDGVADDAGEAEGTWTVSIPPGELARDGSDWTWRAEVTTPDGATVQVCTVHHVLG
ncbi:hypothetical protein Cch01nite_27010 [Cellulomonas chitinilytica]|uniref:RDD domain-containing protein n=1 Tax=Cellulomonas chitinilytica TaxID=398759 RepID=A0A919P4F7_9CELL|nr:RDD family protein [Cellulomonas chitinilytica]GIG21977.1 hypothetical protein Cch01nite_27010 [Cellulomonas chitinilytica]